MEQHYEEMKQRLYHKIRNALLFMDNKERLDFLAKCTKDYCRSCGNYTPNVICHCSNDE
jgi:hypothetical protein